MHSISPTCTHCGNSLFNAWVVGSGDYLPVRWVLLLCLWNFYTRSVQCVPNERRGAAIMSENGKQTYCRHNFLSFLCRISRDGGVMVDGADGDLQ